MEFRRGRLRHQPVPLEIWSADRALKVKLDAALWLRLADRNEIETIAKGGWTGVGADAFLVRFFEPLSDELAIILRYADEAGTGLCFQFDCDAALSWIRIHRPQIGLADSVSTERADRVPSRRGPKLAAIDPRSALAPRGSA